MFITPTPPVKSTKTFPSTSVSVAPVASATTMGKYTEIGSAMTRRLRSRIFCERGPGMSVCTEMTRCLTIGSISL